MRQTKAMSPQYAIRWWHERGLLPPERDPVEFMFKKVAWRYAKGRPEIEDSKLYLGDSRVLLGQLGRKTNSKVECRAKLLLTSPPYYGVTNYFYDQWLRLWLLGGPPQPRSPGDPCKRKFENKEHYVSMLRSVFAKSKPLLAPDAVIYVRTDAREFTLGATLQALDEVFPDKKVCDERRSLPSFTQTALFDADLETKGEIDLVLW
jgi:hypothetical protein